MLTHIAGKFHRQNNNFKLEENEQINFKLDTNSIRETIKF